MKFTNKLPNIFAKKLITKRVLKIGDNHVGPQSRKHVLETKSASLIIKRFNWENKQLFGPCNRAPKHGNIRSTLLDRGLEILAKSTLILPLRNRSISSSNQDDTVKKKRSTIKKTGQEVLVTKTSKVSKRLFPLFKLEADGGSLALTRPDYIAREMPPLSYPSVTKILQATMPPESIIALDKWKEKMIKDLGQEGFEKYRQSLFSRGRLLHKNIQHHLNREEKLNITEEIKGFWESLAQVLTRIEDVQLLEKYTFHPYLCYKGIVDCVGRIQGDKDDSLVVIDWKTATRRKSSLTSLYDDPIQAVAYLASLNYDTEIKLNNINKMSIVVAYDDGHPAEIHILDSNECQKYWKKWLKRLKIYWENNGSINK